MADPTKADLAAQLETAREELAAVRELLAAIAACADLPTPSYRDVGPNRDIALVTQAWNLAKLDRLSAIKIWTRLAVGHGNYLAEADLLRKCAAEPLPYHPAVDQAVTV